VQRGKGERKRESYLTNKREGTGAPGDREGSRGSIRLLPWECPYKGTGNEKRNKGEVKGRAKTQTIKRTSKEKRHCSRLENLDG